MYPVLRHTWPSWTTLLTVSHTLATPTITGDTLLCTGSSKAALDMLTKMMGLELGKHKVSHVSVTHTYLYISHTLSLTLPPHLLQIRVNSVNPTVVMTDMGKMAWSQPSKAGPVLNRIPAGRFVGVYICVCVSVCM